MTRRITVPDGHVALILPNQLVDEVNSLATQERTHHLERYRRQRSKNPEVAYAAKTMADLWGDIILALLEAR